MTETSDASPLQAQSFPRSSDQERTSPPPQRARWMYARGDTWATFQPHDDEKLEKRWQQLGGEGWARQRCKQQDQGKDEQEQSTTSSPRAPPSGVDAIQSALHGSTDVAKRAKYKAKSANNPAACQSSRSEQTPSSSSWLSGLRNYMPFAGQERSKDDRDSQAKSNNQGDKQKKDSDKVQVNYILDPDEPETGRKAKVEVMEDNLFDVDLESMTLFPCFWKGVALKVVRATWFYSSLTDSSYVPISWDDALSRDLDNAYSQAQPWLHSTEDNENDEKKSFSPLFNISLPWAGDDEKDGASRSKGFSRYTEAQRKGSSAGAQSASKREGAAQTASKPPSGGGADGSNQANPSTNGDKDERRSFAAKLIPSSDAALRPLVTLKKLFGYDENEAADEEKRKVKQQMTEDELDRQRRSENDLDLLPDDRKDEPPELVFAIHVDSDVVHPEAGRYGCLAAENVYNCFNPNDPVAFQLAPTVDSGYAKLVKPISIENATEALLHSLALPRISVSRIFEKYKDHPFQGVGKIIRQAKILENDREALPADLSRDEKEQRGDSDGDEAEGEEEEEDDDDAEDDNDGDDDAE
ncbi:related to phosphatidic acid-preferring phospholipase A1 [Ustilago bromivora]|uniref:Related to phosphatidic acid-preferring phospholipase A1 n=1 Tax=Ustilago bromivora TaxID=307758 RepID=A0A8H8TT68_9BASI|nr:related to phosphatidic acid-preferring phospholipase A1 [Ustilago bromivora]